MKCFNYSNRNFGTSPHLFGILLILAGSFAFASPYLIGVYVSIQKIWIIGGIVLLIGVTITVSFSGILIDYSKNSMKEYFSIFGIKMGEWESLPEIKSVRITEVTRTQSNISNGVSPTLSGRVTYYLVTLEGEDQEPTLKLTYEKKGNAISASNKLASNFGVQLIT